MRKFLKRVKLVFRIKKFIPFLVEFFVTQKISWLKKLTFAALIIGYFWLPLDIIPDFLTVFGLVDDLAVLMFIFQQMIKTAPIEIKEKHGLLE